MEIHCISTVLQTGPLGKHSKHSHLGWTFYGCLCIYPCDFSPLLAGCLYGDSPLTPQSAGTGGSQLQTSELARIFCIILSLLAAHALDYMYVCYSSGFLFLHHLSAYVLPWK